MQISHVTWYAEYSRRSLYALPLIHFLLLYEDTLNVFITKAINFLPSPWRWRGKLLRSKTFKEKKGFELKVKIALRFRFFFGDDFKDKKVFVSFLPVPNNFYYSAEYRKKIVEIKSPTSGDDDEIKKKITFSERHLTSWWMTWSARVYGNSSLWMRVILMLFGGRENVGSSEGGHLPTSKTTHTRWNRQQNSIMRK